MSSTTTTATTPDCPSSSSLLSYEFQSFHLQELPRVYRKPNPSFYVPAPELEDENKTKSHSRPGTGYGEESSMERGRRLRTGSFRSGDTAVEEDELLDGEGVNAVQAQTVS